MENVQKGEPSVFSVCSLTNNLTNYTIDYASKHFRAIDDICLQLNDALQQEGG